MGDPVFEPSSEAPEQPAKEAQNGSLSGVASPDPTDPGADPDQYLWGV